MQSFIWEAEISRTCTGINYTDKEILQLGERVWNLEKIFNLKNEFTKEDDTLPPRLLEDLVHEGHAKGKVNELDEIGFQPTYGRAASHAALYIRFM